MMEDAIQSIILEEASALGRVTGLMAGFVFTATVLVLSNPPRREGDRHAVSNEFLKLLLISLISLVFSSVLFALVGRFSQYSSGLFLCSTCALFIFVLGSGLITLCLGYLVKEYGAGYSTVAFAHALFQGMIVFTTLGMLRTLLEANMRLTQREWLPACLVAFIVALILVHLYAGRRGTSFPSSRLAQSIVGNLAWYAYAVVMLAIVISMLAYVDIWRPGVLVAVASLLLVGVQIVFVGCQAKFVQLRDSYPSGGNKGK